MYYRKYLNYLFFPMYILTFIEAATSQKIPVTSDNQAAKGLYQNAIVFENKLEIDSAIVQLQEAMRLDSSFVLAYIKLGMIKDDFDKRKSLLKQAMKYARVVSDGEKLWLLGRNKVYGDQKGMEEFECFKRLAAMYPNDENANYLLANVYVNHGRYEPDSAVYYYKNALLINPLHLKSISELAYVYMTLQRFEEAETLIKQYIHLTPGKTKGYDIYAEMLMKSHQYEASIKAYENVLGQHKNSPWAVIGIAANMNFLKRYKEARHTLLELQNMQLTDHEYRHIWRSLLCSYLEEGDIDSAISILKKQRDETLSGINTREPHFHKYITLSRLVRLYFEKGDTLNGLMYYKLWKDLVTSEFRNEQTIKNVLNVELYYKAYAMYIDKNYKNALELLENYNAKENVFEDVRLLRSKIFLSQQAPEKALKELVLLNQNNAYYLAWLAHCYKLLNRESDCQLTMTKISNLIQLNNIDYAMRNFPKISK